MPDDVKSFMIEDARLIFRNFAGKEDQYNKNGDKHFSVILPPELAEQLASDGWNVKMLPAREEGEDDTAYIQVGVRFDIRPPRVVLISSNSRTNLNNDTIESLDYVDIKLVDLICTGYDWAVGDKSGTKAYLKSMFVTINEDPLELKYGLGKGAQKDDD